MEFPDNVIDSAINLPEDRASLLKRTLKHELGHFIAAHAYGRSPQKITIERDYSGGGAEVQLIKSINTIECMIEYARTRVIILYSGVIAESIVQGKIYNKTACELLGKNGKNDYYKAREVLQILRNIQHGECNENEAEKQINKISNKLWDLSIIFIAQNTNIIDVNLGNIFCRLNDLCILQKYVIDKTLIDVSRVVPITPPDDYWLDN